MDTTNFSNRFLEAQFTADNSLLTVTWLPSTYEMSEEEYKNVFMEIADYIDANQVQRWMGYTKDFAFVVSPELQEWSAGEFNQKLIKAGLQKMAIIIPADYIANLGVQQSISEMEQQREEMSFETRYFDNPEQAKAWLLD